MLNLLHQPGDEVVQPALTKRAYTYGSNMNYEAAPAKTFNYRGWDVQIFLTMVRPTICSGYVDIFEDAVHRCRIVLAGQMDEASAILSLERRSADWVEEWLSRNHTGKTGFSEL